MDYLPLGGRRRGFTPRALVSSSITHRCVILVFASLFPYLCLFIFCCGCDFNWLRLFINSVYSLCSFSAHFVFVIKLELVFLFWGSKRSKCILHYLNFHDCCTPHHVDRLKVHSPSRGANTKDTAPQKIFSIVCDLLITNTKRLLDVPC